MSTRDLPPIHSGEILVSEFLKPMGISQYRLIKDIGGDHAGSMRLCVAGVPYPLTRRSALGVSLAWRLNSGYTCKPIMIWKWPKTG